MSTAIKVPAIFTAIDKFTRPLQKMSAETKLFQAQMARMERSWRNFGNTAMSVGRNALFFTAAIATPLIYATKLAVEFEDKMADVGKTTGLQGHALEKFGDQLLEMSTTTRTSIDDLVKIGEIGGQLGVAESELLSFVDSANKFNVALGSDFTGGVEEAVSSISKIKNLFGSTRGLDIADSINRTGSAINELGAVGSGTSYNITDFALRVGALPDAVKPSLESILALGTYLEESGVDAQIASSGFAKLIELAGTDISAFAQQMNMTSEAATELFNKDSLAFIKQFSQTFKGMSGTELSAVMDDLGIGSMEAKKVIGALSTDTVDLATGMDRLTTLMMISNDAFSKGTSLQTEYNKKNSTSAAQWEILKNNLKAATITLGQAFLPVLVDLMKSITPMIKAFGKWAKENKPLLMTITKIVAGVAAFSGAISILSFGLGGFSKLMTAGIKLFTWYKSGSTLATIATKIFSTTLMGMPLMWVIAGVAALVVGIYKLTQKFKGLSAEERVMSEIQSRVNEKTASQIAEVKTLFFVLRNAEVGTVAYNDALEKINEIQPGIIEKYNLQAGALRDINAAEQELISSIQERARTEAAMDMLTEKYRELFDAQQKIEEFKSANDYNNMSGEMKSAFDRIVSQEEAEAGIPEINKEINVLTKMATADKLDEVDPSETRANFMAQQISKEMITVDFKNVPIGTQITGTGGGGGFNMPSTSSTR